MPKRATKDELITIRIPQAEKRELQAAATAQGRTISDLTREAVLMARPTRMWPKGQLWADYQETIPAGIPLKTVMTLEYWSKRAERLRPFDVIDCVAEDGSFDARIRLVSKTSDALNFRLIEYAECDGGDAIQRESLARRFVLVRGGQSSSYSVFDNLFRKTVAEGLDETTAEAERQNIIDREAA